MIRLLFILLLFLIKTVFITTNLSSQELENNIKTTKADSLESLLNTSSDKEKFDVLVKLIWEYSNVSPQKGLLYGEQGLKLARKLADKEGEARIKRAVANPYLTLGKYKQASENTQQALVIFNELENEKGIASSLNALGIINYYLSNFNKALEYFNQSLKIREDINDKKGVSKTLSNIGAVYEKLSQYDKALEYNLRSLKIEKVFMNKKGISRSLNNIGLIHFRLSQYNKALDYLNESLKIEKELGDKQGIAQNLINIGVMYDKTSQYDKALEYYHKSLKMEKEIGNKQHEAALLNNIGATHSELSENDKALEYYNKSLKLKGELEDKEGAANTLKNIGLVYSELHDYDKAFQYHWQSLELANELNFKQIILDNYFAFYEIYSLKGNCQEAFNYYKLYTEMEDSIYNKESSAKIAEMETKYETEKKEKEIELLKKDKAIHELQVSKQKKILYFFFTLFVLVIIVVFLLYNGYRIKTKAHKEIITQKKQIEEQVDQLKELDRTKSHFFANISHEFRTPLTLIIGPLERLLSITKDNKLLDQYRLILRNAKSQLTLVNQLLELSKIDKRKMKIKIRSGNLNHFIKTIVSSFSSLAEEKHIRLNFTEKNKGIHVYFDWDKLQTIITNLLSNAFKFTLAGGSITVLVGLSRNSHETELAEIVVRDTGIGIEKEHLNRLFEQFYQVENFEHRSGDGTGIGLALTKELVKLHHGEITVKSEPDKGTEFKVRLKPGKDHFMKEEIIDTGYQKEGLKIKDTTTITTAGIAISEHEHHDNSINENSSTNEPVSKKTSHKILVIEDNSDMRQYIIENLSSDYHVIEAKNGLEGINRAINEYPDLIISDVMMPGMDGFELCDKLKSDLLTSHIPVILLTALAAEERKLRGLKTGADAYITKPYNIDELQIRIDKLIEQRRLLRERYSHEMDLLPENIIPTSMDEKFLQRAISIVKQYISDPDFNVDIFIKKMHISRAHLHNKLKALTDQSTTEFIRTYRIKIASELLKQNKLTISEIAFEVGFVSHSYFSSCFRKQFGLLPSEYVTNNN